MSTGGARSRGGGGRGGKKIVQCAAAAAAGDDAAAASPSPTINVRTYAIGAADGLLNDFHNDIVLHLPIRLDDPDVQEMMSQVAVQQVTTEVHPAPYESAVPQQFSQPIDEADDKATAIYKKDTRFQNDAEYIQCELSPTEVEPTTMQNRIIAKRNVLGMMLEFKEGNRVDNWIQRTSQACMWCCHSFECQPIAIPSRYENDRFHVYGCFCSFACAAQYIFDTQHNDSRWDQYSLLNLLYKRLHNLPRLQKVRPAPPRESLQMFGGIFTIEEFRQQSHNPHYEYSVTYPPMIAVTPRLEEVVVNHQMPLHVSQQATSVGSAAKAPALNVPINQVLVDKAKKSLQDRQAAGRKPNSLQAFLNLQVRQSGDL